MRWTPPKLDRRRAGLTLLEVVVSLLVLLVGVTGVIILFPIGVSHVRQAVLDTRCTLAGQSMWAVVESKGMADDPLHRRSSPPAAIPPAGPPHNFLVSPFLTADATPTAGQADATSHYITVAPSSDASLGNLGGGTLPFGRPLPDNAIPCDGLPLLIDPWWVEAENERRSPIPNAVNTTDATGYQNRQAYIDFTPVSSAYPMGANHTPQAIRVVTTAEVASIVNRTTRLGFLRRWFASPDDMLFVENRTPGTVVAPNNNGSLVFDPASTAFPLDPVIATATRDYFYSWALLVQRPVTGSATTPPAALGAYPSPDRKAILVFYRRNLANPYTPAIAAFVNGDSRATIRYAQGNKPQLRKGAWICELSALVFDWDVTPIVPAHPFNNRFAFNFHRVADFEDRLDSFGPSIVVTLEKPPTNYNTGVRGINYLPGTLPDPPPVDPGGTPGPNVLMYAPIVIFDGLQEVYDEDGLWGGN